MPTTFTDDLRLAHVLADDADSLSTSRYKALDLHVVNKPDLTPVTDADKSVEEGIRRTLSRARPRDAVLGEETGLDRAQPATLGGGPDRRHQELRARRPGVGDADRADGRRRGGRGLRVRADAAAPLVGLQGRRRLDRAFAAARPPSATSPTSPGSTTRRCPTPSSPAGRSATGSTRSWRCPGAAGGPGRTATSGPTCCSPRARWTWPRSRSWSSTTWPRSTSSSARPAACSRPWTAPPARPVATRWPATAGCTTRRWRSWARCPTTSTTPTSRHAGTARCTTSAHVGGLRQPAVRRPRRRVNRSRASSRCGAASSAARSNQP